MLSGAMQHQRVMLFHQRADGAQGKHCERRDPASSILVPLPDGSMVRTEGMGACRRAVARTRATSLRLFILAFPGLLLTVESAGVRVIISGLRNGA